MWRPRRGSASGHLPRVRRATLLRALWAARLWDAAFGEDQGDGPTPGPIDSAPDGCPEVPPAEFCVFVTTYDRPRQALALLKDVAARTGRHRVTVRVYDDHSTAGYREVRAYVRERGWSFWSAPEHGGKRGYWRLVNRALEDLSRETATYFLMLQDDVRLCSRFFDRCIHLWEGIEDPDKVSLFLLKDSLRAGRDHTCWTDLRPTPLGDVERIGWVDCNSFLCRRRLFETIGWRLHKVHKERWRADPTLSSGVGRQLTLRLHEAGGHMYRTSRSLTFHVQGPSKMNPSVRRREPIRTVRFVDGPLALLALAKRDPVVASVASVPDRESALGQVVATLLPQVDHLNVYLNGYSRVPRFLDSPRISVARSQDHGDRGDAGKFFWCEDVTGFHFTCDDDIAYPPDYVRSLVGRIEAFGRRAVVAVHGAELTEPFTGYYRSRRVYSFRARVRRDRAVHVLGTGTVAYHTATIRVRRRDFRTPNMADVWFALVAQRAEVPFVCLAHGSGWLRSIDGTAGGSIYSHSSRSRGTVRDTGAAQTRQIRAARPWSLFGVPDRGARQPSGVRSRVVQSRPLVSCLCVTEDRPEFIPWLLWNFDKQTHPERELVVVDSSEPPLRLDRDDVRIIRVPPGTRVGPKRNVALAAARGRYLTWMDDDDWQHPCKLTWLVDALGDGAPFAGPCSASFVRLPDLRWTRFTSPHRILFNGGMYRSDAVRSVPFDVRVRRAADTRWLHALMRRFSTRGKVLDRDDLFFWLSHTDNLSNPATKRTFPHPLSSLRARIGERSFGDTLQRLDELRGGVVRA